MGIQPFCICTWSKPLLLPLCNMGRKGGTELVVADIEGWQLITQRQEPLFGAITFESLKGTEKPDRRERRTGRADDTGMRLGELSRLQLANVNLEDGFVMVHGKGGKDRYGPIGREMVKCLWRYMKKRALTDVSFSPYLFLTEQGKPLTSRAIQLVFNRLHKKSNLDGVRLSPRILRHSFALAISRMVVIPSAYNEYWGTRTKRRPQSM